MAIAKPFWRRGTRRAKPRSGPVQRRTWPWLLAAGLIAALYWGWTPMIGYAQTGAAVGARVGCSCHFVAGRALDACRSDFEPGMGLVSLSADEQEKTVTARFALLISDRARYQDGPGCVLERWRD